MSSKHSLSRKIFYTFVFVSLATVCSLVTIQVFTVYPAFRALELRQSELDTERVVSVLENEIKRLYVLNREYAEWDATYRYMEAVGGDLDAANREYQEQNLNGDYFASIGAELVVLLDDRGNVVWSALHHPQLGALDFQEQRLDPSNPELPFDVIANRGKQHGLYRTRTGVIMLVAEPILRTDGSGPVLGTYVTGKYMDQTYISDLTRQTSVEVIQHLLPDEPGKVLPGGEGREYLGFGGDIQLPGQAEASGKNGDSQTIWETVFSRANDPLSALQQSIAWGGKQVPGSDADFIRTNLAFIDLQGQPAALLQVVTTRDISQIGQASMRLTVIAMFTATLLIGVIFIMLMRRMIISPVSRMMERMHLIRASGDLSGRLDIRSDDEIGHLSQEFNKLTSTLNHTQQDLETTRDEAVALANAKSEFLATMSHEIRTPMNGVLGMAELLGTTLLDGDQREYLENIRYSGDHLLSVINDILDFSKLDSGQFELASNEFDMRELVESVLSLMAVQAHEKGLELVLSYPLGDAEQFVGDPNRIRQVLVNLVGNAIKFTDSGHVMVSVSTAGEAGGGRANLRIEVQDTGIGVSAEDADKIFDAFSQADGSAARQHGGTGLGLSITSRLLKLMGGSVSLDSQPGEGSCFSFELALALADDVAPDRDKLPEFTQERALVADGNACSRAALLRDLQSFGFTVDAVASAEDAAARLESAKGKERYALVMLDQGLPGIGGEQLADAFAGARSERPYLVLMRPSSESKSTRDAPTPMRPAAVLGKPFRQRELTSILRELADLMADPGPEVVPQPGAETDQLDSTCTVLVVDDNAVNQKVAVAMLEVLGCQVQLADDGLEALELIDGSQDLVLMDINMPRLDGFQTTKVIRMREGEGRQVPIIACTAHTADFVDEQFCAAGMNDFIGKPVTIESLEQILRRWVTEVEATPADAALTS